MEEQLPQSPGHEITFFDVAVVVLFFIFSLFFSGAVGAFAARFFPGLSGVPLDKLAKLPLFLVLVQLFAYLLAFVFTRMYITERTQKDFWEAVCWKMPALRTIPVYGVGGFVLSLLVLTVTQFLPVPDSLPIDEAFKVPHTALLLMAFAVLVAPVMEELFFRGLLFPVLLRSLDHRVAIVFTALGFAFLHSGQLSFAWVPLLMLFLVGLTLTMVRYRSQSLAASWLLHFSYNTTLFLVMAIQTHGFRDLSKM